MGQEEDDNVFIKKHKIQNRNFKNGSRVLKNEMFVDTPDDGDVKSENFISEQNSSKNNTEGLQNKDSSILSELQNSNEEGKDKKIYFDMEKDSQEEIQKYDNMFEEKNDEN